MLGTFLTDSDPVGVPEVVILYMAEQLGIADWSCAKLYPGRLQTKYEHAWEIRDLLGYRDFGQAEQEVAAYIASRVSKTRDSRRDLFDRAVVWLVDKRVLLPGITTLARLVTEVRRTELEQINARLAAAPAHMRRELLGTLAVPAGKSVSTLEWMRTPVTRLSGRGMAEALDRPPTCSGWGPGRVDISAVAR
jgi:hypothetical protein